MAKNQYSHTIKRILDLCLAIVLLPFVLPVLILIAVVLLVFQNGEVIFIQKRIGLNNQPFNILKFCTMRKSVANGSLEVTRAGRLLRKYSLDELPQIFNVIGGSLSFIGPRPLLPEYLSYYTQDELKRHQVRPGITGLAQINGRNDITWEEKFRYDLDYVNNISFLLDLKILLKTFPYIFTNNYGKHAIPLDEIRSKNEVYKST